MALIAVFALISDTHAAPQSPFAGRLVKSSDNTAVYFVGDDNVRHAFPNEKIYFTWYTDFSDVVVVSNIELASYQLGQNVKYRPGSRLVKIQSVPDVYAVEPWGKLRMIPDEDAAIQLYGVDWAQQVDDIDISFFFDYEIVGEIFYLNELPIFPVGTVISINERNFLFDRLTDDTSVIRPISALGRELNRLFLAETQVLENDSLLGLFEIGLPVITAEARLSCAACKKELYAKKSVLSKNDNESGWFQIQTPANWHISFTPFTEDDFPQKIVFVNESLMGDGDDFSENFFAYRWKAEDFNNDITYLLRSADGIADEIYYKNTRLYTEQGYDLIYTLSGNQAINWSYLFAEGEYFYQLQFTGVFDTIEAYLDVIYLLQSSFVYPR